MTDTAFRLKVGDTTYDVDPADIDGLEWRAIKEVTGMSFGKFGAALAETDLDAIGALLWVTRRRTEPDLDYDEVVGSLTINALTPDEEGDRDADPPDSAGS